MGEGTARSGVWAAVRTRLAAGDGFTLAEMVVVMGVLLIILTALTTLFVSATRTQVDMSNRFQAQQNARLALDKLRHEIHCASAITAAAYPASSMVMRLGGYCPTADRTTLPTALTIGSGTYSITVTSAATFPAGALSPACPTTMPGTIFCVYVGNSGRIECAGVTGTTLTGCTGGAAGTYAAGTRVAATNDYTWCTTFDSPSGTYSLYRYRGGSCSGTGNRWADHLTTANVFPASNQNPGELRTLSVNLPVDLTPQDSKQRYTLSDDIVLRNSGRS